MNICSYVSLYQSLVAPVCETMGGARGKVSRDVQLPDDMKRASLIPESNEEKNMAEATATGRRETLSIECESRGSLLYEATLVRNMLRYLRPDGFSVVISCKGESADGGDRDYDATGAVGTDVPLWRVMDLLDEEIGDFSSSLATLTWRHGLDVSVSHRRGAACLVVSFPPDATASFRRQVTDAIRAAVELSRL